MIRSSPLHNWSVLFRGIHRIILSYWIFMSHDLTFTNSLDNRKPAYANKHAVISLNLKESGSLLHLKRFPPAWLGWPAPSLLLDFPALFVSFPTWPSQMVTQWEMLDLSLNEPTLLNYRPPWLLIWTLCHLLETGYRVPHGGPLLKLEQSFAL